jgi:ABC-2 type transport system ATP-binding protein
MSGLDPLGRREVRSLLQDLKRQGKTIVLSSHIVPDVEQLADAVGILRDGRLVLNQRLDSRAGACTYLVRAAVPAATVLSAGLPDWAFAAGDPDAADSAAADSAAADSAAAPAPRDDAPPLLTAADAGQLRELLDACHRAGLPVQTVEAQRSGLEDLFMQTHARRTGA